MTLPGSSSWFTRLARERSVQAAAVLWVACSLAVVPLVRWSDSKGTLPFQRPAMHGVPITAQVIAATVQLLFVFVLMVLTWLLTRRRQIPDMAARAPAAATARREVLALWVWGAACLGAGQLIGRWLFGEGIGLHLNGSLFGATRLQTPREVWFWALYNLICYAVVPLLACRLRGYSREALNLKSANPRNDALVVVVILAVEAAGELAMNGGLLRLSGHQVLAGGALSFLLHLLGTGLPVMVFIYSILLPRYLKLTGSVPSTLLLGAASYVALHVCESWTVYDSPGHALLSLIFVVLTFTGPGLIKSYLTLRTGNAWVHLWAYHAIAPHVTMDTPLIVKVFQIR
jgi:hypothetical protein